ncbi:nicotinamide N-methyltransferase isoform X2 [Alligator mississippiensis]|uniref:nicotinamide N-methyltransferase isoform X2 n=1 Tax=Alligator mississippiensis TaxID=8496 RepID=UPI002877362E|nr:nicotinamide N-methyltransferase isoform X2 [Alligator mississippiensis]
MAAFTGGEVYKAEFEPTAYLEYFKFGGGTLGDEFLTFVLKHYCKTFTSGDVKGDTLIDIGSGPTIYQLLSACEKFNEIIVSDYADRNRQELEKWLKKEPGAFDWTPVVKYVCELEGQREKWAEKEEKLRKKVKQVLKCDVRKPNPLAPVTLPAADCLLSTLCLEAACKDLGTFRAALKNISSLVKPGGHLVMVTVLKETYYVVDQHSFSCLYLDQESVEEAIKDAGFDIKFIKEIQEHSPNTFSDFGALLHVVACKRGPKPAQ